jgi:hypothetical protein
MDSDCVPMAEGRTGSRISAFSSGHLCRFLGACMRTLALLIAILLREAIAQMIQVPKPLK